MNAAGPSGASPPETPGAQILDLSGLKCPLPALRTRKALRRLAAGGRLAVTATDPLARLDIPNAAMSEGAVVEHLQQLGPTVTFLLRKL